MQPDLQSQTRSAGQLARFVVVGCSNVAIDWVGYQLFLAAGLAPMPAKGLSYFVGMFWGFFANKFWTFQSSATSAREPILYTLVYIAGLAANVAVNAAVLAVLGDSHRTLAFLAATAVSTVMNFCGMKYLAFKQRESTAA